MPEGGAKGMMVDEGVGSESRRFDERREGRKGQISCLSQS